MFRVVSFILEFHHSRKFHDYNTRHRDVLRPPLAKTSKYQGSFRVSGTKIWNSVQEGSGINKV